MSLTAPSFTSSPSLSLPLITVTSVSVCEGGGVGAIKRMSSGVCIHHEWRWIGIKDEEWVAGGRQIGIAWIEGKDS